MIINPLGVEFFGSSSAPPAPTNVVATPVSFTEIDVTWDDPPVTVSSNDGQYSLVGPTGSWTTSLGISKPWDVTGLMPGVEYWFQVRTNTLTQTGTWSASVSAVTFSLDDSSVSELFQGAAVLL